MKQLRKIGSVLIALLIGINSSVNVYAATANDLFSLYNQVSLQEVATLQAEYTSALNAYNEAMSDAQNAELFNALFDTAENYQKSKKDEIDNRIQQVLEENKEVANNISANIEGDWDSLVLLEVKYKNNKEKIEQLLDERDKYILTSRRSVDYEAIDRLSNDVDSMSNQYAQVTNVSDLGDIAGIRYPLNCDTYVTSEYGYRLDPITGDSIRFHAGIDLSAPEGTEVVSLFNGVVEGTGFSALGGNYVKVNHGNGIVSYYCHLNEFKCKAGDVVKQYDVIALSGNTGSRTTGPHLHLGLYINGNSVDPGVLFGK